MPHGAREGAQTLIIYYTGIGINNVSSGSH
jgi:hypothetical protein